MSKRLFLMTLGSPSVAPGTKWAIWIEDIAHLHEESPTSTMVHTKDGCSRIVAESLENLVIRINNFLEKK